MTVIIMQSCYVLLGPHRILCSHESGLNGPKSHYFSLKIKDLQVMPQLLIIDFVMTVLLCSFNCASDSVLSTLTFLRHFNEKKKEV